MNKKGTKMDLKLETVQQFIFDNSEKLEVQADE